MSEDIDYSGMTREMGLELCLCPADACWGLERIKDKALLHRADTIEELKSIVLGLWDEYRSLDLE